MSEVTFRQAALSELSRIVEIIDQAKERMRLRGSVQWLGPYPGREDIARDLARGYGYVLCCDNQIAAYGAVVFDGEPAYEHLQGTWPDDAPYVVVHRLAVADGWTRQGLATEFMRRTGELALQRGVHSFRVDTNFDNLYMQRIMTALGFAYCGEVEYRGDPRMAYHKALK